MKRIMSCFLSVCLLISIFSGCMTEQIKAKNESNYPSKDENISSGESETEGKIDVSSLYQIDPQVDPPLYADIDLVATPDFLTEEQTLLYQRAWTIWSLFRGSNAFVWDNMRGAENSFTIVEINGLPYIETKGNYSRWNNFLQLMNSIFVTEYTEELITASDKFLERNETVYVRDGGKSGGFSYIPPDTFELISETSDKLEFYVIGHYKDGVAWTEKFPIEMVLTEAGWRFCKFATAGWDNSDPPACKEIIHE